MKNRINIYLSDRTRGLLDLLVKNGIIENPSAFLKGKVEEEAARFDPFERQRQLKEELAKCDALCAEHAHARDKKHRGALNELVGRFGLFISIGSRTQEEKLGFLEQERVLVGEAGLSNLEEALSTVELEYERCKRTRAMQTILGRYRSKFGGEEGVRRMVKMPGYQETWADSGFSSVDEMVLWCEAQEGK